MQALEPVFRLLPPRYRAALGGMQLDALEELRLRVGRAPTALISGAERPLALPAVTQRELEQMLAAAMEHSCYAVSDRLREGFVSIQGGHRLGVCGTAATQNGAVISIRDISSICIRIARPLRVAPDGIERWLDRSTLIIGPPESGKTTLLRDCIRRLSNFGQRVCVCDSRGEIAACYGGVPQLDVGAHTDVLAGCCKSTGLMLLLRAMNPQWLAVDEITDAADMAAIEQCSYCGVRLLATAHADGSGTLRRRPLYRRLCELGVFEKLLVLDADKHVRMERMG